MATKKSSPAWWRAFGWRPRAGRRNSGGADFADMGTVFGLEASLAASEPGRPADEPGLPLESSEARQRSANDRLNGRSVR